MGAKNEGDQITVTLHVKVKDKYRNGECMAIHVSLDLPSSTLAQALELAKAEAMMKWKRR